MASSNQSDIYQTNQSQLFTLKKWCLSKRKTLRKAGEWAVVTGGSSGIGEAYAEELAKEGLNIMLISNDEEQLSAVSNRIANTYNVQTRIVVADFTKKGPNPGIINIGSYSGLKVFPHATMYSSTKASIIHFSKCLAAEKYQKNVIIQAICPLFVSTKMSNSMKTTFFIPTAEVFAKSALDMFGVEQQTTGYIRHDLKAYLYDLLPTSVRILIIKAIANSSRKKV
ncbi:unnamed protein product [Schistosoma curassoni]|uniref:NAD(P)-binding protein n=1 Tax=Schistosoma curassoni TaxID=6186 RepID=A0A183KHK9_9TREM|nr:unnamed protein product [Schistosoma curassoni]